MMIEVLILLPSAECVLDELGPALAAREDVSFVAVYLCDETSRQIPRSALAKPPSFEAALEVRAGDTAFVNDLPARRSAYRVATRHVKRPTHAAPTGRRTPGVFMLSPVYRRADLSAEAFDRHWRDTHAPLAVRHHTGMNDYRQNPVLELLDAAAPRFDGIARMGFPSLDDYRAGLFDSPEGMKIIMEDTERFLSLDRSESAMMGEYVLLDRAIQSSM